MIRCRPSALSGALELSSGCAVAHTPPIARLLRQQLTRLVLVQQPLVEQAQRSEAQVRRLPLHVLAVIPDGINGLYIHSKAKQWV